MGMSMDRLNVPVFAQPLHLWLASLIFGTQLAMVLVMRQTQIQTRARVRAGLDLHRQFGAHCRCGNRLLPHHFNNREVVMSRSHPVASAAALAQVFFYWNYFYRICFCRVCCGDACQHQYSQCGRPGTAASGHRSGQGTGYRCTPGKPWLVYSAEDLLDVRGIGPVTLAKIRLFLHVETVSGGVGTGAAASGTASGGALTEQQKEQAARALVRSVVRRAINAGSP